MLCWRDTVKKVVCCVLCCVHTAQCTMHMLSLLNTKAYVSSQINVAFKNTIKVTLSLKNVAINRP